MKFKIFFGTGTGLVYSETGKGGYVWGCFKPFFVKKKNKTKKAALNAEYKVDKSIRLNHSKNFKQ